jgi:hypothetical protein
MWLEYEVAHTPLSNAEVKNEWSYTSDMASRHLLRILYLFLYPLPQPNVWIMCFLCKVKDLVLEQVMITVVLHELLIGIYC